MTRTGKCDVCRFRKVKCDETRPRCRSCQRGHRPCNWEYADYSGHGGAASKDGTKLCLNSTKGSNENSQSTLALRSARSTGSGSFRVFSTLKSSGASRGYSQNATLQDPITDTSTALVSRWCFVLPETAVRAYALVPGRLGSEPALDTVVNYLFMCYQCFTDPSESNKIIKHNSGVNATRSLRTALTKPKLRGANDNLLLSILVMRVAEFYGGAESFRFFYHSLALGRILQAKWRLGTWRGFDQRLLHAVAMEEVTESVVTGTRSMFDDPALRQARMAPCVTEEFHETERIYDQILALWMRLPRLLCCVRQAISQPNDPELFHRAWALIETINQEEHVPRLELPTYQITLDNIAGKCFKFSSSAERVNAISYNMYLCSIYGTMQRLSAHLPSAKPPELDLEAIQMAEVEAAETLIMSVDYSFRYHRPPNAQLGLQQSIQPLLLAYATFKRWKARCNEGDDNFLYAVTAQDFCKRAASDAMALWMQRSWDVGTHIEDCSEVYSGGPTMPWLATQSVSIDTEPSRFWKETV